MKKAAANSTLKKRGPKPFSVPATKTRIDDVPHKSVRRPMAVALPEIVRPAEEQYPLVYRERNKHARNNQRCREAHLVASPENMIAVVFEDGGRLVTLRRNVHELEATAEKSEAGTETDRKFWGTR